MSPVVTWPQKAHALLGVRGGECGRRPCADSWPSPDCGTLRRDWTRLIHVLVQPLVVRRADELLDVAPELDRVRQTDVLLVGVLALEHLDELEVVGRGIPADHLEHDHARVAPAV